MKRIGLCKQCLRNVPHILYFQWPVFRLLNRNLVFADSLPLGSWHCCGCEKNSFRLKRPDPEVNTDVTSTDMKDVIPWPDRNDPSQRFGLLFRRKRKSDVVKESDAATASKSESGQFEHVGNVTRSDDSLLVRKARASRYSKKYRESVIDRILSGTSTISQIRKELGLSERDLLDWINDRVMRQDQKIAKLGQIVEAVKELTSDSSASPTTSHLLKFRVEDDIESPKSEKIGKSATVDGSVNRT